jgi:hypothetical protein
LRVEDRIDPITRQVLADAGLEPSDLELDPALAALLEGWEPADPALLEFELFDLPLLEQRPLEGWEPIDLGLLEQDSLDGSLLAEDRLDASALRGRRVEAPQS